MRQDCKIPLKVVVLTNKKRRSIILTKGSDFMKKIISIILVLVICLSCCFVLSACSDDSDTRKRSREEARRDEHEEYRREAKAEVAKSNFSAVMESYNGYVIIKGRGMSINEYTTIQDVIDFLDAEGQTVTVDHLNTSLTFLSACEERVSGYYTMRDDVEWYDYYAA